MSVPIVLVAAVALNGVIGRDNGLPWRLSSDLKRFKEVTIGKPVVVGRRNHEAIGNAPARHHDRTAQARISDVAQVSAQEVVGGTRPIASNSIPCRMT